MTSRYVGRVREDAPPPTATHCTYPIDAKGTECGEALHTAAPPLCITHGMLQFARCAVSEARTRIATATTSEARRAAEEAYAAARADLYECEDDADDWLAARRDAQTAAEPAPVRPVRRPFLVALLRGFIGQ